MLPKHGKIECRACFGNKHEKIHKPNEKWKIVNDPGAWGGGSDPEYLVLGFSKGSTQANYYDSGSFEDVAFAGLRPRLTEALRVMNVISETETCDMKISDPNSNIAFGSLIRCSVSRIDNKLSQKNGVDTYACTGSLITKSFLEIPAIIDNCTNRYLTDLPSSLKAVFLLGNSDLYVENCMAILEKLFQSDFKRINSMAVFADGKLWIHLAHPSGLNGHFKTWLNESTSSGLKRIEARAALEKVV